jgi:hypothetical protein
MRESQSGTGPWGQVLDEHVGLAKEFHENCMVLFILKV